MEAKVIDSVLNFVSKWLKTYVTSQVAYVTSYEKNVAELKGLVGKLEKERNEVRYNAEEDEDKFGREMHHEVKAWLGQVETIVSQYKEFKKLEDRECLGCFLIFPNFKAKYDGGKIAQDIKDRIAELEKKKQGNDQQPPSMGVASSSNANVEPDRVDDGSLEEETDDITVCDASDQSHDQQKVQIDNGGDLISSESQDKRKALEKHEDRECLGCVLFLPYLMKSFRLGTITEDVEESVRVRERKRKGDLDMESIMRLMDESINQLVYVFNPKKKIAELDKGAANLKKMCEQTEEDGGSGDVEQILSEIRNFKKHKDFEWGRHSLFVVPNPITRYQQGKIAQGIKSTVEALQKQTHDNRSRWRGPLSIGDVFSNIVYESFKSRTKTMDDIMGALQNPTARMIGVYGQAGIGKTTLVIEAANRAREAKLFDLVILANVTRSPVIKKIQGQIADMLGMTLEEESEQGRAARIKKRLKKEKENTLVILDDLYEKVDLNLLGIPIDNGNDQNLKELVKSPGTMGNQQEPEPKNENPSIPKTMEQTKASANSSKSIVVQDCHKVLKILFISDVRQALVKQMDEKERKIFSVNILNDKEAETLFKNMAGVDDDNSEFGKVAVEIARKCNGLPMSIVTTARALKGQRYPVWEDTRLKLERQKQTGTPEYSTKLSYQLLESEEHKIAFLLCARMGQDALISDLVKVCIGMGFLEGVYSVREARDRVQTLIVKLKESGLLSDSYSSDRFTMQNLVRSAALSIASEVSHVFMLTEGKLDEWPDEAKLRRYTAISLRHCHIIKKFPQSIKCPRLRVFQVENNGSQLEIPENFFREMKELRVLILAGMDLSTLPISIGCLTKLRMLCLEHCKLREQLQIIGKLKDLRILSFSGSNVETLPMQLKHLSKLQVFDVSNCSKLCKIPANVISNLTSLEELYMRNTQWWASQAGQNFVLSELRHLDHLTNLDLQIPTVDNLPKDLFFDKLYSYKIVLGSSDRYSESDFKIPENYELLRFLAILGKEGYDIHSKEEIKMMFERVENLLLEKLDIKDIFYELNLKGFPCLKYLSIMGNSSLESLINPKERKLPEEAFTKLKSLHLHKVMKMVQICSCQSLSETSFANLKVIKIKLCPNLTSVFSISMVGHLVSLETVEVSECKSMQEIVPVQTSNAEKTLKFRELRSLVLQSLSHFIGFYPTSPGSFEGTSVPTVKTKILFHDKIEVSKLETMELSSIPINHVWASTTQLKQSPYFENLVILEVRGCKELKYLMEFSMARNLVKLQRLLISECDKMEHIFSHDQESKAKEKDAVLPKLKNIKLSKMRRLCEIWNSKVPTSPNHNNLDTLVIEECHKLVNVFTCETVVIFQSLGSLTVKNCKLMEAIFDLADAKQDARYKPELQDIHLETLPKLERVLNCPEDQEDALNLNNIQKIWLQDCENLENVFPLSVAKTVESKLEYLIVWDCSRLRKIVAEGKEAGDKETTFEFPKLTTIKFLVLPKLERFYPGDFKLLCPNLKDLSVEHCDMLEPFKETTTNCVLFPEKTVNNLKSMQIEARLAKSSSSAGFDYRKDKLEELHLSGLQNIDILYSFLHHCPNLKSLWLNDCSFKVLVPHERIAKIKSLGVVPKLKGLNLTHLDKLMEIGFERNLILQRIESLILKNCSSLATIAPSSVSLFHLTKLEVADCSGLKYLMSPSTAKSLVQLNTMKVINCASLEDIVRDDATKFSIVFRQLKALELVSLKNLKSFCRSKTCVFEFPSLEKFVVSACPKLENFSEESNSSAILKKVYTAHEKKNKWCWRGSIQATIQYIFQEKKFYEGMAVLEEGYPPKDVDQSGLKDRFYSLKTLKMHRCKFESTYAISSNVLRDLKSLEELEVSYCRDITVIFECDMNETEIEEAQLPLKMLSLKRLHNVTHVWRREEEGKQGILSFKNLQDVYVNDCRKLQTVFPVVLARYLEMLEKLEVSNCDELAQVVGKKGEADGALKFPRLTKLVLSRLRKLTCFYSETVGCIYPELDCLHLCYCLCLDPWKFFDEGMVEPSVFVHPQLQNGQRKRGLPEDWFYRLKTLKLSECKFESTYAIPSNVLPRLKSLQELEVSDCKDITFIFEMNHGGKQEEEDKEGILSCKNLQRVTVKSCDRLQTMFPAALARYLEKLESIVVGRCGELLQIVGDEDEAADGPLKLPRLSRLELYDLPNLSCFYSGEYTVECSNLDYLYVYSCHKLKLFREDEGGSSTSITIQPFLSNIKTLRVDLKDDPQRPWGQLKEQDLQYLSELHLNLKNYGKDNFTLASEILKKTPNLEKMQIQNSNSLKEISLDRMLEHLKRLTLHQLHELHSMDVLKYLPKLQELSVSFCPRLTTLVHPLAAENLKYLEELHVGYCESMKDIVEKDETGVQEIKFERLQRIILQRLSNLKCFYGGSAKLQLPTLIQMDIRTCPNMKSFSRHNMVPPSTLVQVSYRLDSETELVFHRNLNVVLALLGKQVSRKKRLVLGHGNDYPPIVKGIWLGKVQIPHRWRFENLEYLEVEGCKFLSNAILPSHILPLLSNLQELMVRKCDSVRTIFDVKDTIPNNSNMSVIPLRRLTLEQLPRLMHVWNEDPKGRLCLPDLEDVIVSECESIESLLPVSVAKDNLRTLYVRKCGKLVEIVAKDEAEATATEEEEEEEEDVEANQKLDMFPMLTSLTLWDLPKLRCIASGIMDTLEWPKLESLDVYGCQMLTIFSTDNSTTDKYSIVSADKVPSNLERLSLTKEDVILFEKGLLHVDLQNIKFLRLGGFREDFDAFPSAFFSKVSLPNMREFAVADCTFKEIFHSQILPAMDYTEILSQLTGMELRSLPKLESIGFEQTWMALLLEKLEVLKVLACTYLTNLVPFTTVCFSSLAQLNVEDCVGLKYLFTPLTAKSLVKLKKMSITNCESLEAVLYMAEKGENSDDMVEFPKLSDMSLEKLPKLESFYKGKATNLEPSPISFSGLTEMNVGDCGALKYLFTSSTAKSLVELKKMSITNCESLEAVVYMDENRDNIDEVVEFPKLSYLSLVKLPKLESFSTGNLTLKLPCYSSFSVEISQCKSMKTFSLGNDEPSKPWQKLKIDGVQLRDLDLNSAVKRSYDDLNSVLHE